MQTRKKILFRADGNSSNGLGHLYRLFSLVETVKSSFEFIFVTSETSNLEVIPSGYNVISIPKTIILDEEPKWLSDKFSSREHVIIADGYQFVTSYQKAIKDFGFKLIYIDDLTREHMFADVVINHSSHIEESNFKAEPYTKFALGTKYALLRPLFLKEAQKQKFLNKINIAFVCFGGADSYNLCYKYAKALIELGQFEKIHIVIGAAYQHINIFELKKEFPEIIETHKNLSEKKLLGVMKKCNFAVVPTSTILFEIFCVKMPVYSGFFVDNQKHAYKSFKSQKLVGGDGLMILDDIKIITNQLKVFIKSCELKKIIQKQEQVIDGLQASRHLELINNLF